MLNVQFPLYDGKLDFHRYYNIHYKYILGILGDAKCAVKMVQQTDFKNYTRTAFELIIDGKLVAIDFSDFEKLSIPRDLIPKYKAIFKFHYDAGQHGHYKNIYPFSPVSFQNWDIYKDVINKIQYKAKGLITCKQKPGGAAVERRNNVQALLEKKYKNNFDKKIQHERDFYLNINNTLVAVCVPGARNNMLDRGQGQYMALGCCTISPCLPTTLSYNKLLIQGQHYVVCKNDYSDLIEKIDWVSKNKEEAIQIGKNAKALFEETSLPVKQVEWIKICLGND